jgi:Ca2+:H+ antiporter
MDLAFPAGLVLIVLLSVLITGQVAGDGRSEWLKGVQLLAVYVVLGLTFFFMPADARALMACRPCGGIDPLGRIQCRCG